MNERDHHRPAIRTPRDEDRADRADRDVAKGDRTAKQSQPGRALGAIRA